MRRYDLSLFAAISRLFEDLRQNTDVGRLTAACRHLSAGDAQGAAYPRGGFLLAFSSDMRLALEGIYRRPDIESYQQTIRCAQEVDRTSMAAINETIDRIFAMSLPPEAMAARIARIVGLYPKLARAVLNYEDSLVRRKLEEEKKLKDQEFYGQPLSEKAQASIRSLVNRYAERMLRYRIMLIARTETKIAEEVALDLDWRARGALGELEGYEQEWVSVIDSRRDKVHCAKLHGLRTPIGMAFATEDGFAIRRPPVFPSCRCTRRLVRRGPTGPHG